MARAASLLYKIYNAPVQGIQTLGLLFFAKRTAFNPQATSVDGNAILTRGRASLVPGTQTTMLMLRGVLIPRYAASGPPSLLSGAAVLVPTRVGLEKCLMTHTYEMSKASRKQTSRAQGILELIATNSVPLCCTGTPYRYGHSAAKLKSNTKVLILRY